MSDTETDRLWSALDKTNQYVETLEARLLRLETTRTPERPARQVGDYLPDPVPDQGRLTAIRAILSEMPPPSGIPSPAQRLLLRIKAVIG